MRKVFVAGVHMTRFAKMPEETVRTMAEAVVAGALADAGVGPDQVGATYFGNAISGVITGQEMVRGQSALRNTGVLGGPVFNVENACSSSSSAFNLAWQTVASGQADVVLVVGAEKMTEPSGLRAMQALESAVDLEEVDVLKSRLGERADGDRSFFMDLYAGTARGYLERTGATAADFAQVSVKNHLHSSLNPHAQFRKTTTVEEVLASRTIVDPLTLLMCSAIGDGAAAVVLCAEDRLQTDRDRIEVLASVVTSGYARQETAFEDSAVVRAAARAYDLAGVGPEDLQLVELHDAAAPAELVLYEELGLCPRGDGAKLLASGATTLGGRLPVNTSGGLLGKGHPVGATGCAQITEIAEQMWGRAGDRQVPDVRLALAENGGGYIGSDSAAAVVTILSR
ncbi:thiolase family protein [Nocardioides soli]|uniref:Acetyl-CoA acetyltransferase n=1 Tax=Nocardioides soli TaxID=1036020 RepID=A0A7W4Z1G7_9ACTN|nr:thiolase family protein [Nocardioides soli]MBB3042857.1 acetyl-CoA acetyltransferase [Nocardioides soli]